MTQALLNRIAGVGLVAIILAAVGHVCVTIFNGNKTLSAVPITYKVVAIILCWSGIALLGGMIYLLLRRFTKP